MEYGTHGGRHGPAAFKTATNSWHVYVEAVADLPANCNIQVMLYLPLWNSVAVEEVTGMYVFMACIQHVEVPSSASHVPPSETPCGASSMAACATTFFILLLANGSPIQP